MKQAKSKNRNRSEHEELDDSLRPSATNIGLLVVIQERQCQKPRPQASHW